MSDKRVDVKSEVTSASFVDFGKVQTSVTFGGEFSVMLPIRGGSVHPDDLAEVINRFAHSVMRQSRMTEGEVKATWTRLWQLAPWAPVK